MGSCSIESRADRSRSACHSAVVASRVARSTIETSTACDGLSAPDPHQRLLIVDRAADVAPRDPDAPAVPERRDEVELVPALAAERHGPIGDGFCLLEAAELAQNSLEEYQRDDQRLVRLVSDAF